MRIFHKRMIRLIYTEQLCLEELHAGGKLPRSSTATVNIDWMYPAIQSTNINRRALFCFP